MLNTFCRIACASHHITLDRAFWICRSANTSHKKHKKNTRWRWKALVPHVEYLRVASQVETTCQIIGFCTNDVAVNLNLHLQYAETNNSVCIMQKFCDNWFQKHSRGWARKPPCVAAVYVHVHVCVCVCNLQCCNIWFQKHSQGCAAQTMLNTFCSSACASHHTTVDRAKFGFAGLCMQYREKVERKLAGAEKHSPRWVRTRS